MARNNFTATFDAATELKDAGVVTANGAATVNSVARVVNVGPAFIDAMLIVDVDLLKISANDELYEIILQGSNDPTFATGVANVARVSVGKASVTNESADSVVGRYMRPIMNSRDGTTPFAFLRIFTRVSGTAPSINFRAFITKDV